MAQKEDTFFGQLYKLSKNIDTGTKDLQNKVEEKPHDRECDNGKALYILHNTKKDVNTLKLNAETFYTDFCLNGTHFGKVLTACQGWLDSSRSQLDKVENHLSNYGYTKPVESCEEVTNDDGDDDDIDVEVTTGITSDNTYVINKDNSSTNKIKTPPNSAKKPDCNKTPKLEDFGISAYGMQVLMGHHQHVPNTETRSKDIRPISTSHINRLDSVPQAFQHNGLIVTPSIVGKFEWPPHTPDSCMAVPTYKKNLYDQSSVFSPDPYSTQSPVAPVFRTPGFKQINTGKAAQHQKIQQPSFTSECASPVPPVFRTPGAKQIQKDEIFKSHHKKVQQPSFTSNFSSPVPPTFQTPGMKGVIKASIQKEDTSGINNTFEEPEPPELTSFIFQDLTERSSNVKSVKTTTKSRVSEPKQPDFSMYETESDTPPKLELLSSRLKRMGLMSSDSSELPTPPRLLRTYDYKENSAPL